MSITKYASLENVQVLELHGSATKVRHASLGKLADFHMYRTDDGFLYARIRAISSRVNKNHDGWPSIELAGGQDVFDRHLGSTDGFSVTADSALHYGFSTFLGKPIFVDHHNSDPDRARGVIVDAKLHVDDHKTASLDPYYASPEVDPEHLPGTWVELLLEVDAKSFPKFAKAIVEGSRNPKKGIDGWSMGCDVEKSVCSICKNAASSPEEYCNHIKMKGAHFDHVDEHGRKTSKKAYENCYGVGFFEISGVFDPADETALSLERARTSRTATPYDEGGQYFDPNWSCQGCGHQKFHHAEEFKGGAPGDLTRHCANCGEKDFASAHIPYPGTIGTDGVITPSNEDTAAIMQDSLGPGNSYPNLGPVHQGSKPELEDADPKKQPLKDLADLKNEEWLDESGEAAEKRKKQASTHTAENPLPQSEMSHAPEPVDTLREEEICPVCGSSMDEDTCDVCGYQEPPEGFDNPDLTKVQDADTPQESPGQGPDVGAPPTDLNQPPGGPPAPEATNTPNNPTSLAHVTSDMGWEVHQKTAARINKTERPLVAIDKPQTNEPQEKILSDQLKPVTSRVRTAEQFIAAAGATRRNTMNHTAEAATGAPDVAKPDVKTDVTGVGGVDQASNDAASKADAQIDVTGIGGTGVEGVGAEKEGVKVKQGDEHSKNIEAIPTKTFGPSTGDSLGQQDPVTSETPYWVDESKWSNTATSWIVEGHDDDSLISQEQQGGAGTWGNPAGTGTAVKGVKPIAEQFGERVNVLEHQTTPANNSGPTTTWTGTEGNGVLKQQDPVTPESIALGESQLTDAPNWTSSTHIFAAFKLADLEVDMGLIGADQKYARAAELEQEPSAVVAASLRYAQRVRQAAKRTAGVTKLPVMGRPTSMDKEASTEPEATDDGSFMFGGV